MLDEPEDRVYLAANPRNSMLVKIGVTRDLHRRGRELGCAILATQPG